MIDTIVVRFLTEGVRRKCLGVLFRTIQIAASHLRTTDPQLTLLSVLHQLSLLIYHVETERIEWLSDGRILLKLPNGIGRGKDGTFRRTIYII